MTWDFAVYTDDDPRPYVNEEGFATLAEAFAAAIRAIDVPIHRAYVEVYQNDGETLYSWSSADPLVLVSWGSEENIPLVPA